MISGSDLWRSFVHPPGQYSHLREKDHELFDEVKHFTEFQIEIETLEIVDSFGCRFDEKI
jgi:hypothetical protein